MYNSYMKDLIVLDTETTGVEAKRDSIIEIAAIKLLNGGIVDRFQTLVKPETPLSMTVSVLTGIKAEELATAPDIKIAGAEFLKFAGDLPIVGHNISFDTDFLKAHGIDPPGHSLDTLDLAITLLPKLPFHSLQFLAHYYQLKNQPSHRAMSDVLATVDLVNVLIGLVQNVPSDILKNIQELSAKSDWEWSWVFDENNSWRSSAPFRHPELAPALRSSQSEGRDSGSPVQIPGPAGPEPSGQRQARNDGKGSRSDVIGEIKPGFNVYELPPTLPQMVTNIASAVNDDKAVLVVSNDVFQKNDWSQLGLNPYFGSVLQLDAERFNFLISKPKLRSTEFKLLVKVLLTGYPEKPFNPANTYLTKDEFYLWEQKLAPFQFQITPPPAFAGQANLPLSRGGLRPGAVSDPEGEVGLPAKTVLNFASFYEILENNPESLQDKHIYLPQWVEFDEWATNKSAKMFTSLYVNAIVASRRDFIHDFVADNKTADELFKLLNNLGSELNDWWASVEELWGEQASGSALEISGLLVADKTGKAVKTKAEKVAETLNTYLEKIKSISFTNQPAQQKQVEHTTNLLEHFNLLTHPGQSAKNYLNGYNDRVILNVVKQPVANIWQSPPQPARGVPTPPLIKGGSPTRRGLLRTSRFSEPEVRPRGRGGVGLKGLSIVIASNGILVNGKPDFISALLGESIKVSRLAGQQVSGSEKDGEKPITFVSGLPDRNRDENYQSEIFEYLTKKIINPKEKILIVFPNVAMMAEFFEANHASLSRHPAKSASMSGVADAKTEAPGDGGNLPVRYPEPTGQRPSSDSGSGVNLFSQNVAGNVEMLQDKLAALDGFTLLISGTNLAKFLGVLDGLDKTVFLTMPFDIPGSLSSVLAKDRFRNEFADYGLPKAIVKFKANLAELYSKTKEILILDSRLISTDWGQTVPNSLSGFQVNKI